MCEYFDKTINFDQKIIQIQIGKRDYFEKSCIWDIFRKIILIQMLFFSFIENTRFAAFMNWKIFLLFRTCFNFRLTSSKKCFLFSDHWGQSYFLICNPKKFNIWPV